MPKITYIQRDGSEQAVDVPVGNSVMQGAVENDIDGIVADCGGNAACATCHVYVDDVRLAQLPEMGEEENEMLEFVACPRKPNSRLSCQLEVTDSFDELRVYVPETQF